MNFQQYNLRELPRLNSFQISLGKFDWFEKPRLQGPRSQGYDENAEKERILEFLKILALILPVEEDRDVRAESAQFFIS